MSEPKRYAIRGFSAALVEEENGVFVRYEDYARLKAEVERLKEDIRDLEARLDFLEDPRG
jgi:ubiquinone biosynthesis protein UbiJ